MIGQELLLSKINKYEELPRFLILIGTKGCGKKTLSKMIADKFGLEMIIIGTKIDEIRNMISIANEAKSKLLFVIDEGDKMTLGAKNTLLKITEEAPNNVYIILTSENSELVLPTLLSRGEKHYFSDYKNEDFKKYCADKNIKYNTHCQMVLPNLSYLEKYSFEQIEEIYKLSNTVLDKIKIANAFNAFKLQEKLKIKDTDEGIELNVFVNCLYNLCLRKIIDNAYLLNNDACKYQLYNMKVISTIKQLLTKQNFSKSYIADKLIIDLLSY